MPIKTYHFDSLQSVYQYDPIFTPTAFLNYSYAGIQSMVYNRALNASTVKGGHSFFSNFPMVTVPNVTAISLASVEMPVNFYNIRNSNLSDTMTIAIGSSSFTVVVPNINYLSIQSLLDAINYALGSVNGTGWTLVFSINPSIPTSVMVTTNLMNANSITIQNGVLSNTILGMAPSGDNSTLGVMKFSNSFNLNPDNYLNMVIKNMAIPTNNPSGIPCTFKIPLPTSASQILFYNNQILQRRILPNLTIPEKLQIQILDRWGFPIFSNGGDYSFSLCVET